MAEPVPIRIFNIARTMVDREEVRRWLDCIGAEGYEIPPDGAISDPALLVALAAKRCYMSFEPGLNPNVTRVRTDLEEYLSNIISSKHGSVLEHAVYTFAIENVSRVFTGEMNRHRAGWAISEGSMRFIRYDNIRFWMPDSIVETGEESEELAEKKAKTRALFLGAFEEMEEWQAQLAEIWGVDKLPFHKKKQLTSMFRRLIGMGIATGGVWSGNLRALRHVLTLRTHPSAEEEIRLVCSMIASRIIDFEPEIFADFNKDEHGWYRPTHEKV